MIAESTGREPGPEVVPQAAEPTLADLMGRLARRVSFNAAMAVSAACVVLLALVLAFWPGHWRLALLLAAMTCAGGWTMAEHEGRDALRASTLWRAIQSITAILGVVSIFAFLLAALSSALGLWIS